MDPTTLSFIVFLCIAGADVVYVILFGSSKTKVEDRLEVVLGDRDPHAALRLDGPAPGDGIDLLTAYGNETYRVTSIEIVDPSDVSVLAPTEQKILTLVTCYPFYYAGHAPQRYIVKAIAEHTLVQN